MEDAKLPEDHSEAQAGWQVMESITNSNSAMADTQRPHISGVCRHAAKWLNEHKDLPLLESERRLTSMSVFYLIDTAGQLTGKWRKKAVFLH